MKTSHLAFQETSRRQLVKHAIALPVAGLPLLGLSHQQKSWAAQSGDLITLRVADGQEPNSIDPHQGTGPFGIVIYSMFETLVAVTEELEPVPGLATGWQIEDDSLTWTFHLKEGVTFHDGSPFTSESVKGSFDRILNTDIHIRKGSFSIIEEVIAEAPYVVKFRTTSPYSELPAFLGERSAAIINPVIAENLGPEEFSVRPVGAGTGPFRLVEWVPNDHITMDRFDDYHNDRAAVDQVIVRFVPEASSREAMILAGEVDVAMSPSPQGLESLRNTGDISVVVYNTVTSVTSELEVASPPFNQREVRQALNYAIDSQGIISSIMADIGTETTTPGPVGLWGTANFEPYTYDPTKARELLVSAGYPDGFDCSLRYVSGRWAGDDQVAQAIQAYWSQIGVRLTLQQVDLATQIEMGNRPSEETPGWTSLQTRGSSSVGYHLDRLFHSNSALPATGYKNDEVDQLLDAARSSFDEDERLALYEAAQEVIWEDAPFVWPFSVQGTLAHRNNISGLVILPNLDVLLHNVSIS